MLEPRWHLVWSVLLGALVLTAWAPAVAGGTDGTDVPIIRPLPGYPRIFVQAELPNGERGLFLVDTGADISVLSRGTAERLGLPIQERYTRLEGLSGTAWMDRAVLPSIGLGEGGDGLRDVGPLADFRDGLSFDVGEQGKGHGLLSVYLPFGDSTRGFGESGAERLSRRRPSRSRRSP